MDVNLKFPVILINKSGYFGAYSGENTLSLCGERYVDDGLLIDAEIIDSGLKRFAIKDIKKIGSANFLPSFLVSYNSRMVRVDFELEVLPESSFEEIQTRLVSELQSKNERDQKGLLLMIRGSEHIENVMECIGID